jgi:hypothetical protein
MKKPVIATLAAAAALLCAAPGHAQSDTTTTPQRPFLITVNPLGVLVDYYNIEFERALSDVTSISLAAEHSATGDTDISAVDVRFRYYPQARVFSGLALGASLGYGSFDDTEEYSYDTPNGPVREVTGEDLAGPTLGLEVNYNWLVGRDRRLFVGLGIGARRLLSGGNTSGPTIVPGGRYFGVGYTF